MHSFCVWLPSLNFTSVRVMHIVTGICSWLVLMDESSSLCDCTKGYFFHLLTDVCVVSSLGLLMLLRTFLSMAFGAHSPSFLLGLYAQMGLLGRGVCINKGVVHFCSPPALKESSSSSTSLQTRCCLFILAIYIDLKQYPIVILIWPLDSFCGERFVLFFCPFLSWVVVLFFLIYRVNYMPWT